MGTLSEGDCGGKSASRGGGVGWRHGKAERPVQFTMVKTFIGEGEVMSSFSGKMRGRLRLKS